MSTGKPSATVWFSHGHELGPCQMLQRPVCPWCVVLHPAEGPCRSVQNSPVAHHTFPPAGSPGVVRNLGVGLESRVFCRCFSVTFKKSAGHSCPVLLHYTGFHECPPDGRSDPQVGTCLALSRPLFLLFEQSSLCCFPVFSISSMATLHWLNQKPVLSSWLHSMSAHTAIVHVPIQSPP